MQPLALVITLKPVLLHARMAEDASGQKLLKPLDSVSEVGYGGARQRGGKGSKAVGENGQLINGSTTLSSRSHAPVPAVPNGPLVVSAGWGRTGTSSLKVTRHEAARGSVDHQAWCIREGPDMLHA